MLMPVSIRPADAYDWLQFGGNAQHNGLNTSETILTTANIGSLVQKYQVTLAGTADSTPVFLENINTAGGVKNLVFVTTKDGRIIALDAQNGAVVWAHQNPANGCKVNNGGTDCYTTSSPAIDPNRQYVYSYGVEGKVHKYQVGDGNEITSGGWPQVATLKPYDEKGPSALGFATAGGVTRLYVTNGGFIGDAGDYQGHVTAINLATGAQSVFNAACSDKTVHLDHFSGTETATTCAAQKNAIWARPGAVYDPGTGLLFMATGNSFNAGQGRFDGLHNWSESVIALHPDASGGTGANAGKPFDSYTPSEWSSLDDTDTDVGSTGPVILPVPAASTLHHLALQSGKDSKLRLLNLDDLSGMGGPGNLGGSIGAPIGVPRGGLVFSQPAVWVNPADGSTWIFIVNSNGASAVRLNIDGSGNPSLSSPWSNASSGTSPVVANNMLFFLGGGNIQVLNPLTGAALRSAPGAGSTHWQSLIVANGVVYAIDNASPSHLTAFAAVTLPATTTALTSSQNPANAGTSVTFTARVTGASPTGAVRFADGVTTLTGCSAVALNTANPPAATCSSSTLAVGTHNIVASYGGDANNAASSSTALPQIIQTPAGGTNVALGSAGAVASGSTTFSAQYPVAAINNNERTGTQWGNGGGWNDSTSNVFPDWVQINFNGSKTIDRAIVYTLQDNYPNPVEPTDSLTFSLYGVTDFAVQGWNGNTWVQLGAAITGNNLVKRVVTFTPFTTDRIRINVTNAPVQYSRIVEVEAWGVPSTGPAPATIGLTSSGNPSAVGASVTFTAAVSGNAPTGTISFTDGASSITGCAAVALTGSGNNKSALCATTALTAGTHGVVAVYAGDANNGASSSAPLTQTVTASGSTNVALASNGGVASASSTYSPLFPVAAINDDERKGAAWGNGGGWNDGTAAAFPDWVQVRFNGSKTVSRVVIYTVQDNYTNPVEPADSTTFSLYGITSFTVQGKQGANWINLASVNGNTLVKRTVTFAPFVTDRIRINITAAPASFSRITEVEVWGN